MKRTTTGFLIVGLASMMAGYNYHVARRTHERVRELKAHVEQTLAQARVQQHVTVRNHEVVPGGIHSVAFAFTNYPGMDQSKTRLTLLPFNIYAYVSYRGDDGLIHWTSKRRLLIEGTAVITDGTTWILQRCGNAIAFSLPPDAPAEFTPPDDVFPDTPDEPSDPSTPLAPSLLALNPPPTGAVLLPPVATASVVPAPPTPSVNFVPPVTPCCSVIVNTPEPSVGAMLLAALLGLMLIPAAVTGWLKR